MTDSLTLGGPMRPFLSSMAVTAIVLTGCGVAAATPGQDRCGAAQQNVTQAEEGLTDAVEAVRARAVQLGVTAEVIAAAEAALAGGVTDAEKQSLLSMVRASGDDDKVGPGDLAKLLLVVEAQAAVNAAVAARDIECAVGDDPEPSPTLTPAPTPPTSAAPIADPDPVPDSGGQVTRIPLGSVDAGGGPVLGDD